MIWYGDGSGLLLLDVVLAGRDNLTALAVDASRKALEMAKVDPDDLDLILMCTSTPEDLFGSAPQVRVQMYRIENSSLHSAIIFILRKVMCIFTLAHFKRLINGAFEEL